MEITDTFRVTTPLDETWRTLLDIERIAPCLPGAQLEEIEGDEYRGVVKVKVGPITAQYKGVARLIEVDEAARRIVIDAQGRDTRGAGNAKAAVVVTMQEEQDGTRVDVATDLSITGKVAQFGRGTLAEVSAKLLHQFAEQLERDVLTAPPPAAAEGLEGAAAGPETDGEARRLPPREVEPVDLLAVGGAPVARRLLPAAAVVVVLVVLWRLLRRRPD